MFFLLCCACFSRIEVITKDRFNAEFSGKKNNDVWCFLFYTPFCKKYKENYVALEQADVLTDGAVKYATINCQGESLLCSNFKVTEYPSLGFWNRTKFSDFQEPPNPSRIAKVALSHIRTNGVKEVDDFWIDDYREKPSAIMFTKKKTIPGFWAAASRLAPPSKLRFGICRDEDLKSELGVTKFPSIVFFNKTHTVYHEGDFSYRYIKESVLSFLKGKESKSPVSSDYHINAEFPEVCYDYSISCVLSYDNFVDPKLDLIKANFKNNPFRFFVGIEQFPIEGAERGDYVIFNAKKPGIIIVKDIAKLTTTLDRVLDGGAKFSPLPKFSYYKEL